MPPGRRTNRPEWPREHPRRWRTAAEPQSVVPPFPIGRRPPARGSVLRSLRPACPRSAWLSAPGWSAPRRTRPERPHRGSLHPRRRPAVGSPRRSPRVAPAAGSERSPERGGHGPRAPWRQSEGWAPGVRLRRVRARAWLREHGLTPATASLRPEGSRPWRSRRSQRSPLSRPRRAGARPKGRPGHSQPVPAARHRSPARHHPARQPNRPPWPGNSGSAASGSLRSSSWPPVWVQPDGTLSADARFHPPRWDPPTWRSRSRSLSEPEALPRRLRSTRAVRHPANPDRSPATRRAQSPRGPARWPAAQRRPWRPAHSVDPQVVPPPGSHLQPSASHPADDATPPRVRPTRSRTTWTHRPWSGWPRPGAGQPVRVPLRPGGPSRASVPVRGSSVEPPSARDRGRSPTRWPSHPVSWERAARLPSHAAACARTPVS